MEKFLEMQELHKLNQEKIEALRRPINKKSNQYPKM